MEMFQSVPSTIRTSNSVWSFKMETSGTYLSNDTWDIVWHTFANVSHTYDLVSSQNVTNNEEAKFFIDNPAKLGIATGLLIACLADFRTSAPKFQLDVSLDAKLKSMAITLLNIAIFLLLAPPIATILTILVAYRKIVELLLIIELREEFAGLLVGTDCVWALEESTALSVINVLGILENDRATTNDEFLSEFRTAVEKRLLSSHFEKLNCLREKKYGYHYWRRSERKISIEEHVRWMDEDGERDARCDTFCRGIDDDFLNDILTKFTTRQLPRKHTTSWEILIGRNCAKASTERYERMEKGLVPLEEKSARRTSTIPILFRVHHCVGDGVALLRLLLESIADSEYRTITKDPGSSDAETKLWIPRLRKSSSILGIVSSETEILYNEKNLLKSSMPFTMRISFRKIFGKIINRLEDRWKMLRCQVAKDPRREIQVILVYIWNTFGMKIVETAVTTMDKVLKLSDLLISAPKCLLQQAFRSMDNSALHGPILTGEKLLSCYMEPDSNDQRCPNLLDKIRDIKNITGCRFGDVVLAALSENLRLYFSKIGESVPKSMTVVIPARMSAPSRKLSLQNNFSVGLLTLCCGEVNGVSWSGRKIVNGSDLFERLVDVARSSERLRNDLDYVINFWVMKRLSAILPEFLLRPVLESRSTLVFSNLPGPREVSIIGRRLKNVAFWIPHRGTTGLGCSFLTYGGKVHFSITADTALIRSRRLLDGILRNTVADIEKLYDSISMYC